MSFTAKLFAIPTAGATHGSLWNWAEGPFQAAKARTFRTIGTTPALMGKWPSNQTELGVTKFLKVAIVLFFTQCWPAAAADQNCMASYYRTKSPACIDSVLSQLDQSSSKSRANTVIGFLAQIFSTSPEEKQRILRGASSQYVRSIDLAALYSAGLRDE